MVKFDPNLDENSPGVRRINYAVVDQYTPEYLAHEAEVAQQNSDRRGRLARRKDVPGERKPPATGTQPLHHSTDQLELAQDVLDDVTFRIANLVVYPTGILFDLIASETEVHGSMIGERINVTHRLRPPHEHRVYLGIVLPDGRIVSNKTATPPQAPADDDSATPWLYGGKSYSRQTETGATYFLSPLPQLAGHLVFTVVYPEIGLDKPATGKLDTATLGLTL